MIIPVEREWGGILLSTNSMHRAREGRCWLSGGVIEKKKLLAYFEFLLCVFPRFHIVRLRHVTTERQLWSDIRTPEVT